MDGSIGPKLPPHLMNKTPALPVQCGPCLPPGFKGAPEKRRVLGPSLPAGFSEKIPRLAQEEQEEQDSFNTIGPSPCAQDAQSETVAEQIENRAKLMKQKLLDKDEKPEDKQRETWMTELPTERSKAAEFQMGLQARTFKKDSYLSKPKRDSSWTDTPQDKERKRLEGDKHADDDDEEDNGPSLRDIAMQKEVNELNKARTESLLDIHLKKFEKEKKKKEKKLKKDKKKKKDKRNKKDKKEEELEERSSIIRVPFDRESDLQVNKFDDAKKKSIIRQSAMLNSRFSSSKEAKFL